MRERWSCKRVIRRQIAMSWQRESLGFKRCSKETIQVAKASRKLSNRAQKYAKTRMPQFLNRKKLAFQQLPMKNLTQNLQKTLQNSCISQRGLFSSPRLISQCLVKYTLMKMIAKMSKIVQFTLQTITKMSYKTPQQLTIAALTPLLSYKKCL